MARLGIVADDLTGAVDTGAQFAKWGLSTLVMLCDEDPPRADMVVASTDSRDLPADQARQRARAAVARLEGRLIYKKMDSTLRGNLGPELEGLLDGLGLRRALVAPAFPANGRTTVNGIHLVNGVPIAASTFGQDPIWPATESHLPTILARQTRLSVGHLPISVVQQGPDAVAQSLRCSNEQLVVGDVAEQEHLMTLALALGMMDETWLPCGSAGLAEEWPLGLGMERGDAPSLAWPLDPRPVLVVAGSRNPSTAAQLRRAAEMGKLELVEMSPDQGWEPAVDRAASLLIAGRNTAITSCFSEYRQGCGMEVAALLARAASRAASLAPVSGLFVTGGDVARALCGAVGATALRALGEVQPGVPLSTLEGGALHGVRTVTKAGGFGDELTIVRSIDCLRGIPS